MFSEVIGYFATILGFILFLYLTTKMMEGDKSDYEIKDRDNK